MHAKHFHPQVLKEIGDFDFIATYRLGMLVWASGIVFLNFGSLNALFHYVLKVLCTTIMVAWQLHWIKSQESPFLIIMNHTNLTQRRKRSATNMLEGEQQTSTPILAVQYLCNRTFFSENYKYPETISREKKETKEWSRRATNKKVKNSEGYRFSVGCRRQETEKQRGEPSFLSRSLFSTVSDSMTASAGCRGISVVFISLSKISWCLLFLFSFFLSLRSLSGSSLSSLSWDLVCSFFGRSGSRAKLQ